MPAKKTSNSKAKKVSKSKTAAPVEVAAPAPTPAPVEVTASSESTNDVSSWSEIESQFSALNTRLQEFKAFYTSLTTDIRKLQKNVHKHLKETAKKHKRRRKNNVDPNKPKRAPSGFAKPALISTELCSFLGKPHGTEMARTEVTKYLTTYIKEHSLQDQANRRRILPDKKLGKLLNVPKDEQVTYFNLQKYMKVHFPKSASSTTA